LVTYLGRFDEAIAIVEPTDGHLGFRAETHAAHG
jgi:hypothetical protein